MCIITVVICTYNRAEMLPGAIESVCNQTLSPEEFEILVIDNGSTDNTAQVVDEIRSECTHNIRYVYEQKQGLGYARNTALRAAQGKYIAYMDDDARAEPAWLELALECLAIPEAPICVGGPCYPFYLADKPTWYKDDYEIRSLGEEPRFLELGETFSGSNMIWQVDVLRSIGGFRVDVGVKGEMLFMGEESGAFRKLWDETPNARLYYSPALRIYHWAPAHKLHVSYYLKRAFVTGQSEFKLLGGTGLVWRALRIVRGIGYIIVHGIRALLRFRSHPSWQNWVVEETLPVIAKVGLVFAALGIYISFKR